jgi:ABC-type Mn2+/Zn2+ transport system permease subunit
MPGSGLGILMNMSGFALSFAFDLPVSPAIIIAGATVIFLTRALAAIRKHSYGNP